MDSEITWSGLVEPRIQGLRLGVWLTSDATNWNGADEIQAGFTGIDAAEIEAVRWTLPLQQFRGADGTEILPWTSP